MSTSFNVGDTVRTTEALRIKDVKHQGTVIAIDPDARTATLKTGTFRFNELELVPSVDPTVKNKHGSSSYYVR